MLVVWTQPAYTQPPRRRVRIRTPGSCSTAHERRATGSHPPRTGEDELRPIAASRWRVQRGSAGSALSEAGPRTLWPTTPTFGRPARDLDWTGEAACGGLTGLFFSDDSDDVATAADVCTGCPVASVCAEWRDLVEPRYGVWSGERRRPRAYGTRATRLAANGAAKPTQRRPQPTRCPLSARGPRQVTASTQIG
jgi:hypothetical protein